MSGYVGAIDQGTTSTRFILFDRDGASRRQRPARARADQPAGRLGRARPAGDLAADLRGDRGRRSRAPGRTPRTWRRWASPTSARRPWCGTARAASRSTTRSCGRTPARSRSCDGWPPRVVRTGCGRGWVCRWPATSPGPKLTWLLETRTGRARARRAGRAGLRDDRQLAGVEADRGAAGRRST